MIRCQLKLISLFLPLLLSGCFQAHLRGVVAGSEIQLASLQNPDAPIVSFTASDASSAISWGGQDAWDKLESGKRLAWLGLFPVPDKNIKTGDFYLITARGGVNRDHKLRKNYDEHGLAIHGSWHAVLPAEYIGAKNNKISLLTEACYQWLKHRQKVEPMSTQQISRALNHAAARLVGDVNRSSSIDYLDILTWDIYRDMKHFEGDPQLLGSLDLALTLNFPQSEIQRLSLLLLEEKTNNPAHDFSSFLAARLRATFQ